MGLFDKVLGSGSEKLTEAEAYAGVALCAVAADGVITDEEAMGLATHLRRTKLFQGMSDRQANNAIQKCVNLLRNKGVDELLVQASGAISPELRLTAFCMAADLVLADGQVATEEKRFLEKVQKSLGVNEPEALKIVEVMLWKNKA